MTRSPYARLSLAGRDDGDPGTPNRPERPPAIEGDITTDPTTTQDVVDLLTTDHHEVLDRLEEIKTSTVPDRRRELADVMIGELVRHGTRRPRPSNR